MATEYLNDGDYKTILRNYSKNEGIKYVSSKLIPLCDNVEGFMGAYYTLEIIYLDENEEKSATFFVKSFPTHSELQQKITMHRNVFGKEIFFYNFLMKEYEKHGYDTSFAPDCYYCKDNKILIMENLVGSEYKLSEKNKLYDLDQLKAGLKALALYHSSSILYEEEMTKKLGRTFRLNEKYPDIFKEYFLDAEHDEVFCKGIFEKTAYGVTYVIDNTDNNYDKEEFKSSIKPQTVLNSLFEETNLRRAVGHGDLWTNNIFFKYNKTTAVSCKIVDHQVLRYSHPALDVLLFIHLNSSKEFRKTHKSNLLTYYYNALSNNFSQNNYDISKIIHVEDFKKSLKFVETTAMFGVLTIGTLTFMSPEIIQEVYDSLNDNWVDSNKIIIRKAFDKSEDFRKALTDAVDDLYDSMFRNNYKK